MVRRGSQERGEEREINKERGKREKEYTEVEVIIYSVLLESSSGQGLKVR